MARVRPNSSFRKPCNHALYNASQEKKSKGNFFCPIHSIVFCKQSYFTRISSCSNIKQRLLLYPASSESWGKTRHHYFKLLYSFLRRSVTVVAHLRIKCRYSVLETWKVGKESVSAVNLVRPWMPQPPFLFFPLDARHHLRAIRDSLKTKSLLATLKRIIIMRTQM